ncbi:hypothetical protein KUTeg_024134 [Tegillarca granosa]|uniref:Heat shock 70 kDa protein n=1 Tax=Tegillarca granosa TaxID=220873 RepID=A0ABQ9DWH1_TEGGR|nr:hypothetical protein KUTeg_024134 [Tegillarca granosa]
MASKGGTKKQDDRNYFLVAAIDFGTTFSGYAFSFRHEYKKDPLKISANTWTAGSACLQSLKTSTCVLFRPNGDFHSFGFEAEDKYSNLALDDKHHDWYYFRRFKMMLYKTKNLKRNFLLEDDKGKSMPAMKVFSWALRYLKDHMKSKYENMIGSVSDTDILWAGIPKAYLKIALEPEAASLFCKYLPTKKMECGGFSVFKPGSKYLVLDAGGGTIDITVHQVQDDGSLRELHKANGGDWGGVKVDTCFLGVLGDIVGNEVMQSFNEKHKSDILDLLREFEVKKRTIKVNMDEKITFKVPIMLNETFKRMKKKEIKDELESKTKYKGNLTWVGDKIRMSPGLAESLFQECSEKIKNHLKQLMKHPSVKDISAIIMVGGFSECPIVKEAVKKSFPKVIVPNEAGLSVLKGAVIFGHEPKAIKSRIMQHTYGVAVSKLFVEGVHDQNKKFVTSGGGVRCDRIFKKYVTEGETVDIDDRKTSYISVLEPDEKYMTFLFYATEKQNPMYVTDPGCQLIGKITIDMLDISKGLDRGADVSMSFGGTKLEVEAKDRDTGLSTKAKFDFLN